jgi:arylsulfatase A-like enzyme
MSYDAGHTTRNFTLWPAALQSAGYKTYAIGKWGIGMMKKDDTPTMRGFSKFFGYLLAQQDNYWYHTAGLEGRSGTP